MKAESTSQIKKIAEMLGLSPATVSVVLNGRGDAMRISKKTQERVREKANEFNYRPNIYARRLRTGAGGVPSYVIAGFWNVGYYVDEMIGSLVRSISEYERTHHVSLELVVQPYDGGHLSELKESITSNRYSGIIIFGLKKEDIRFLCENKFEIPLVTCNRKTDFYSCVLNSDYESGLMCAEHFYRKNRMRVGIVGTDPENEAASNRLRGFLDGAEKYGITVKPEWIGTEVRRNHFGGYDCAKAVLDRNERPDALVLMYDTMSSGVLQACKELHISVPDELEIVTHGDNVVLRYLTPTITALRVDTNEPTAQAISMLISQFKGEEEPGRITYCKPEFIYRESSSAPAPKPEA